MSSRDVRIVCPRLYCVVYVYDLTILAHSEQMKSKELKDFRQLVTKCINIRIEEDLRTTESFKDNKTDHHCYSGKVITITYSGCLFVALVCQQAMSMRHIVICGLHGCTKYFYFTS